MRINKYIAHSGVTSRRKADELISKGAVRINGKLAHAGTDVSNRDLVEVDGTLIKPEKTFVYYMLNKPTGFITTVDDEHDRPTVLDLMPDISERIYPIGRLDYMTSGMLLLTNDGDMAYKLTHPGKHIYKTYEATVSGFFSISEAERLSKGVNIGKYFTQPAKVEILGQKKEFSTVKISIREGKNRQVRLMFEALGHKVIRLERTAVGNMKLGHLKQGHYRKLSSNEIKYLKEL